MILHYTDIGGDKIYQTAAAANMALGKAYTVKVTDPTNLDREYNKAISLWPPGYSAVLATLIKPGISPATGTVILDILNGAIFLLLIYWSTILLNFPFGLQMLVLLFKGTEINDAIFTLPPTDYMSLNLWLMAILCAVRFLGTGGALFMWGFILSQAMAPWIRYSNIPLVVVLPGLLIFLGILQGRKNWTRCGLIALAFSVISVFTLLYYNQSRTGAFFYVLETTKGLFLNNLYYLPPLVWMSLININFPLTQLTLHSSFSYAFFMNFLKVSNLILMFILLVYLLRTTRFPKVLKHYTVRSYFFLLSAILSLATLLSLAYLSITRSRNFQIDQHWTYIEEHRYMLLVTVTLMLFFIHEFVQKNQMRLTWPWKTLRILILFIIISETAHGLWIIVRKPIHPFDHTALLYGNPLTTRFIDQKIKESIQEGSQLILMDEDYNLRGYGLLQGQRIIDDPAEFKSSSAAGRKKKKIVFRVRPGHQRLYAGFFANPGIIDCGTIERVKFYELNLPAK